MAGGKYKIAVIDIGSNSVRLMLWADGKTLYKKLINTRLGRGISSGYLSGEAIALSVRAVVSLWEEAKKDGAENVYAFATAAVRSAQNGGFFCAEVKRACGLAIDVVSGREEASLGLYGALGSEDGGVIDIGGASTEICFQRDGIQTFSVSLNVGAVRLYDACRDDKTLLTEEINRMTRDLKRETVFGKVCAIGGTATSLAAVKLGLERYDPYKTDGCPLSIAETESLADWLLSLSAEERKTVKGMDVRRADIIGGGALLLFFMMKRLDLQSVFVSERDNLEGYLTARGLI